MTGQPWLAATFAVFMIGTAGYCLTRLVVSWRRRRPTDWQVDGMHVLMGLAMAGMLVPPLRLMWTGGWEIIFAAYGAVFGYRIARAARARRADARAPSDRAANGQPAPGHLAASRCQSHGAQHLLGCAAMLYMLAFIAPLTAAPRTGAGPVGMLGRAAPGSAVPLLLGVALLAGVVWTADRMSSMARVGELAAAQGPVAARPVALSLRLSACCEIATGVTMGYMLITMLA